jgi:hypothetical protein
MGRTPAQAADLMARAHERCPYSNATRGNIEVTLTVDGARRPAPVPLPCISAGA